MKRRISAPVVLILGGAALWAFAVVRDLGAVRGESIDPSQRARVLAHAVGTEGGTGAARAAGLAAIAVGAGLIFWRRS